MPSKRCHDRLLNRALIGTARHKRARALALINYNPWGKSRSFAHVSLLAFDNMQTIRGAALILQTIVRLVEFVCLPPCLACKSLNCGQISLDSSPCPSRHSPAASDFKSQKGNPMNDYTDVADNIHPMHGANSVDAKARPFVDRVERIVAEMESDKGTYMAKCKANRERIKEVLTEAKDRGLPVKPMKGIIKHRSLERKKQKIAAALDIDEQAIYAQLVDALGELGAAAARAAGFNFAADQSAH
jgi:uncharacterized protein (UPF0335 family)